MNKINLLPINFYFKTKLISQKNILTKVLLFCCKPRQRGKGDDDMLYSCICTSIYIRALLILLWHASGIKYANTNKFLYSREFETNKSFCIKSSILSRTQIHPPTLKLCFSHICFYNLYMLYTNIFYDSPYTVYFQLSKVPFNWSAQPYIIEVEEENE